MVTLIRFAAGGLAKNTKPVVCRSVAPPVDSIEYCSVDVPLVIVAGSIALVNDRPTFHTSPL